MSDGPDVKYLRNLQQLVISIGIILIFQTFTIMGFLIQQQPRQSNIEKPAKKIVHTIIRSRTDTERKANIFITETDVLASLHNVGTQPAYIDGASFNIDCMQITRCVFENTEVRNRQLKVVEAFVLNPGEAKIINLRNRQERKLREGLTDDIFKDDSEFVVSNNAVEDYGYIAYDVAGDDFSPIGAMSGPFSFFVNATENLAALNYERRPLPEIILTQATPDAEAITPGIPELMQAYVDLWAYRNRKRP